MRLQQLPMNRGALWVGRGFSQFLKFPIAFSALLASFFFGCILLLSVPSVGGVLMLASLPMVSLGFMIATRSTLEQGTCSSPLVFLQPLRAQASVRRAVICLGLAYAMLTLLLVKLAGWIDGGSLAALQLAMMNEKTTPEELQALWQDPRLAWGLVFRIGLTCLLALPFWHAPALAYWDGQPWHKALFFSWVACWRNRWAFLMFGLTWVGLTSLFALLSSAMLGSIGQSKTAALATVTAVLTFSTAFYASLYFTYADCFTADPVLPPENKDPADAHGA